jgi:hypothetical protein
MTCARSKRTPAAPESKRTQRSERTRPRERTRRSERTQHSEQTQGAAKPSKTRRATGPGGPRIQTNLADQTDPAGRLPATAPLFAPLASLGSRRTGSLVPRNRWQPPGSRGGESVPLRTGRGLRVALRSACRARRSPKGTGGRERAAARTLLCRAVPGQRTVRSWSGVLARQTFPRAQRAQIS